jgi:hypothetical protein
MSFVHRVQKKLGRFTFTVQEEEEEAAEEMEEDLKALKEEGSGGAQRKTCGANTCASGESDRSTARHVQGTSKKSITKCAFKKKVD